MYSSIKKRYNSSIFEYEQYNDKENSMIIIFQNSGFGDSIILINSNKTIDELIRFYFQISERKDLYGDESITFLIEDKTIIPPYPKESIESLKNKNTYSETIKIEVIYKDDKMKKIAI